MQTFETIVISFLSSLFAGALLLFLIFKLLRPNIKIAECISKEVDGKTEYRFKFYNNSYFGAVNVLPSLVYGTPTEEGDENINFEYKEINLTKKDSFYIPPYKKTNKKTKRAPHCITIGIAQGVDLESLITNYGHVLVFRVDITHQLTNISSSISRTYNRKNIIKNGKFAFGNTFEIVKV